MMDEQTHPYGINAEAIESGWGRVPLLLAPFYLLFRPGRFMLGYGYHASIVIVLLTAWIVGSGRMTNWVVNQQRLNADPLPMRIDSWLVLWGVIIGLGALRAVAEYGLGGLWVWLRLRICGVRGNQWRASSRISIFARSIEMVPLVVLLVYFTVRYDDVGAYLEQPVGIGNYLAGAFMFIAPVSAYIMVRSLCRVRSVWAVVLFLVVPLLWRVAIMAIGLWMANQVAVQRYTGAYPDTHRPIEHASELIRFDTPDGWTIEQLSDVGESIPISLRVLGDDEFAELVIRVQVRDEVYPVEHDLAQLEAEGRRVSDRADDPNVRIANQVGDGIDYAVSIDGQDYKMYHLRVHFDVDHDVLFRFTASERYWWHAMEGWKQVLSSIEIGDLYGIVPDVSNPTRVEGEGFVVEMPGNWHRVDWGDRKPFTHNTQIAAKQYSWFTVSMYDRDMSAEDELRMFLNHTIDDTVIATTQMNEWLGLRGFGIEGQLQETLAGKQQIKALYVPLSDGRVMVLNMYQASSSSELTDPGFQLIEDTFQLQGVEPASP